MSEWLYPERMTTEELQACVDVLLGRSVKPKSGVFVMVDGEGYHARGANVDPCSIEANPWIVPMLSVQADAGNAWGLEHLTGSAAGNEQEHEDEG